MLTQQDPRLYCLLMDISGAAEISAVEDHRCPTCYVGVGTRCVTVHGNKITTTHRDRVAHALGYVDWAEVKLSRGY